MRKQELARVKLEASKYFNKIDFIGNEFAIFNDISDIPIFEYPGRIEPAVLIVCLKGTANVKINLREYEMHQNQLVLILPEHIIQSTGKSDDFEGLFIVISPSFMERDLPTLDKILPIFFYTIDHPCTDIDDAEVELLKEYHTFLWKCARINENPYRREITQNLLRALFYEVSNIFRNHIPNNERKKTRKEELFSKFVKLVSQYFKIDRSVAFYAEKLFITPKHLSATVKEISSKSAGEWIDDQVILEAKALLKTSTLSIQEIAEELNFPNQSFFGKYFKRQTGMTPGDYRKM